MSWNDCLDKIAGQEFDGPGCVRMTELGGTGKNQQFSERPA
jgi:hypothetical protein